MTLTASFDKASYVPGDQITLTVVDDARSSTETETVTVTDAAAAVATASVGIVTAVAQPTVQSSSGRVYAVSADDGTTTVFVTTA